MEVERAQAEVAAERRAVYYDDKATAADGVGEPDGDDHETAERDGDGRRDWEGSRKAEGQAGTPARGRAKTRPNRAETCWT